MKTDRLLFVLKCYNMESDISSAQRMKDRDIIKKHLEKYKIWQGNDGKWRTYLPDPTRPANRRLIKRTERFAVEDAIIENVRGLTTDKMTLRTLFPKWIDEKKLDGSADRYIEKLNSIWKKYYISDAIIDQPITGMNTKMLKDWARLAIKRYNLTQHEYGNLSAVIRQIFDLATEIGIIPTNPYRNVKIPKKAYAIEPHKCVEKETFSDNEEIMIQELAKAEYETHPSSPIAALPWLNQYFGLRISEIVAIKWSDITCTNGIYMLSISKMEQTTWDNHGKRVHSVIDRTKTPAGIRHIPIIQPAMDLLEKIKSTNKSVGYDTDPDNYVFVYKNARYSGGSANYWYRKYCDILGIPRRYNHKVRKTFISQLADSNTLSIKDAMTISGHSDINTFNKNYWYSHREEKEKLIALEKAVSGLNER